MFFDLLIIVVLSRVRCNLGIVLNFISLVTRKVKHFFIYLLASFTSSDVKCVITLLAHFLTEAFILGCLIFWDIYIFYKLVLCVIRSKFFYSIGHLFILLIVSFIVKGLFNYPKNPTKNFLELITSFSNIKGYKIKGYKNPSHLCTPTINSGRWKLQKITFTVSSRKIKY